MNRQIICRLKGNINTGWKLHYFHVDLKEDYTQTLKKLINSLNYYHYADTVIFDFPAFVVFLDCIERIALANGVIPKVIIFNPLASDSTMMAKLGRFFIGKKYTNLLGKRIELPAKFLVRFKEAFEKLHYLHTKKTVVMGFENRNVALKLAARIKNSHLEICTEHSDATEQLLKELA
jgi:hypothetical protein